MTAKNLLQSFAAWSSEGRPLVLATVYETAGSTYSKIGARMLISDEGKFQGMLSGGCLEGDLALRAKTVIETGVAQSVTYDLAENDEALWGLGVGCDGLMRIFLQPLVATSQYEPFAGMATILEQDRVQVCATVIQSDVDQLPIGATLVLDDGAFFFTNLPDMHVPEIQRDAIAVMRSRKSRLGKISADAGKATVLYALLSPPPRILVLGAGLDAEPVVRFALELGWRVTVQDHRPAYIEAGTFSGAEKILCIPVDQTATTLDLNRFSAAIVMSHHLTSDRQYLEQLAASTIPYIGLLGPINRRKKLVAELGRLANDLDGRLHGPAGIDLGGRGPAAIALSIVAEMHQLMVSSDA